MVITASFMIIVYIYYFFGNKRATDVLPHLALQVKFGFIRTNYCRALGCLVRDPLTHALPRFLTHSHSLTHSLIHSLHPLTHPPTQFVHSFFHAFTHLFTHSVTHLFTHAFTHLFTHSVTHLPNPRCLSHFFTQSLIHSLFRSLSRKTPSSSSFLVYRLFRTCSVR